MRVIELENVRDEYVKLVEHVYDHGKYRVPRGHETYDAGAMTIIVHDIHNTLPLGTGRGISPKVAAVEAAQLIAATSHPEMVVRASPQFEKYREKNGTFHGAYGTRVGDQVHSVIEKIKNDSSTRQAVITLWNPQYDNIAYIKDYPCTVALNFAVVDDKLEMNTLMRSNDVWLGTPYDIFQFTQLQFSVARALGIKPGRYMHTAWSLHMYASDTEKVEEFISRDIEPSNAFQPTGIGNDGDTWGVIQTMALELITGGLKIDSLNGSEQWYERHLSALR